ncbi:molybdenum cofactor biosynthesis protein [Rheinheimera riviphila]|uniref:Molybdenum cofactor biosynthesis protein B n=1 Tax=Rheinheimera riviphila TaxID=1834037 RepID=A0A437QBI5_9GAMM|nr:molybdopterin-binding protein [Rheinheimera riviphila]RVU31910.1 molybdenum cofactor biosynthesis protein [Rheinheimera riviphila]
MSKANAVFIPLQVAVITVSDSRTFDNDSTGDLLQQRLTGQQHQLYQRHIVPQQLHHIRACVATLIADPLCQVILLNGGTGFGQDNCTEQAVSVLFDQPVVGFGELFRQLSFTAMGSAALQSRATAGLANHTLIVAMPGSPNAAELAMVQLILPQLDARQQPCNFVSQLIHAQCSPTRTSPQQDSHQSTKS